MSSDEVKNQLHVVHNPFSGATSQPKIPDGELNDSLGYQCQSVFEITNEEDGASNMFHALLYPGINSIMTFVDSNAGPGKRQFTPLMGGAGIVDYSGITAGGVAGTVVFSENFALHRMVSAGAQFKLLNAQDEDDGWWEAVRVNEKFSTGDYRCSNGNNDQDNGNLTGTMTPYGVLDELKTRAIVNDPTYSTGLLRDLHRVQFELHGVQDEHPFHRLHQTHEIQGNAISLVDRTTNYDVIFGEDYPQTRELIEDMFDLSYDMVYLRFHARENSSTSENLGGSRLHVNLVLNQEVYYETGERDNRYHTKTHSIGSAATSLHCQARRASQNAAKLIT